MENNINGKVIIITGASSGIGEAIAVTLASKGAKVVVGARRKERLEKLVGRIRANGGEALYSETDIRKYDDVLKLADLACETYGRLDVMINNAGIARLSRVDDVQVSEWEDMIDVNIKGTLYGMAAALPVFKKQGSGHIINIISTSGLKIVPLQGVYAGTKNAVRTIAEALRQESGGKYRVTGISPGFVNTELVDHIPDEAARAATKDRMEQIAISPQDIANAVVYAISQPDNVDVGEIVIRPSVQD